MKLCVLAGNVADDKLLLPQQRCTARDLAKYVGHAVSMERAVGLEAQMMSRSAARQCTAAPHWEAFVMLDDVFRRKMRFVSRESAVT
jgi:predicted kinase